MADTSQLEAALVGADRAGDVEGAKTLAREINRLRGITEESQSAAERVANDAVSRGARNFTQDEGNYLGMKIPATAANAMAGFYKGARDLGTGLNQLVSPGKTDELRAKVLAQRQLDAPLMATGAGKAGELAFNAASVVPTLAIPGVNTVRGAALLGGAFGAAQPSASTGETATNIGLGTALGGGGQGIANKLVSVSAPAVKNVRDAILNKAADLGFVVSPSEGRSTVANKLMTGLGNKIQTAQEASVRNAATVEKIAKEGLGWGLGEQLTPENFQATRQMAYQTGYEPVEALKTVNWDPQFTQQVKTLAKGESQGAVTRSGQGKIDDLVKQLDSRGQWTGKGLVDDIRTLREEGSSNISKIKDIGDQQLGRAQLQAANALEDLAERNLNLNNAPANLIDNFKAARQTIAKSHTIEDSMQGSGSINPAKFAKSEADAKKLSPEMYAAWKFAKEFPKSNQSPSKIGGVPWNNIVSSSAFGALGYGASEAAGGSPYGAALAAVPLIRGPARAAALSKVYQGAMVNPATAIAPRLGRLANQPAKALQSIAPQISATTAMEIE